MIEHKGLGGRRQVDGVGGKQLTLRLLHSLTPSPLLWWISDDDDAGDYDDDDNGYDRDDDDNADDNDDDDGDVGDDDGNDAGDDIVSCRRAWWLSTQTQMRKPINNENNDDDGDDDDDDDVNDDEDDEHHEDNDNADSDDWLG